MLFFFFFWGIVFLPLWFFAHEIKHMIFSPPVATPIRAVAQGWRPGWICGRFGETQPWFPHEARLFSRGFCNVRLDGGQPCIEHRESQIVGMPAMGSEYCSVAEEYFEIGVDIPPGNRCVEKERNSNSIHYNFPMLSTIYRLRLLHSSPSHNKMDLVLWFAVTTDWPPQIRHWPTKVFSKRGKNHGSDAYINIQEGSSSLLTRPFNTPKHSPKKCTWCRPQCNFDLITHFSYFILTVS